MKHITTYSLLLFICLSTLSCKKTHNNTTDPNNIPSLPPATQIGANTFGCLLNGVPWVPAGSNGTPNLSIDYDPGFNNGIFNIAAYRFGLPLNEQILVGIRDSLNFLTAPITLNLSRTSLYSISYRKSCDWWNQFSDVSSSGTFTLKKLDRVNRIIAGEFNANMYKAGCDTIKIINGRFDFKF